MTGRLLDRGMNRSACLAIWFINSFTEVCACVLLNLFKFRHSCYGMIFFWVFKYPNTSFIFKYLV